MARPYSEDLRERVVAEVDEGTGVEETARRFRVGRSTIWRWLQRRRESGSVAASPMGGDRRSRLDGERNWLLGRLEEVPDLTLEEIRQELAERGTPVGHATVWRFLEREDLTLKKKTTSAAEQDQPDVALARRKWRRQQPRLESSKLIFVDETSANTVLSRQRGRCPRGQRLVAKLPQGHWKTVTLVAGLRVDGFTAPCLFEGAINGEAFAAYVTQCLAPTLSSGDIVITDNLSSHFNAQARAAIQDRGATLRFLPTYSPDLSPIERPFAKLKAALRQAALRSLPDLTHGIGRLLHSFSPHECANYFRAAGYVPT
jgi:transposase